MIFPHFKNRYPSHPNTLSAHSSLFIVMLLFLAAAANAGPSAGFNSAPAPGEPLPERGAQMNGVQLLYPANYTLAHLQVGDLYYVDRDYVLTVIPAPLQDLLWIKTANDDKSDSSDDFISFQLPDSATVYIAYDHRATSHPDWLDTLFVTTGYSIEVSDTAATPLNVWQKEFGPGTYVLGGNLAADADGATSNYLVIFDIESMPAPALLPPVSPKWVYEPWVWEDHENTQTATWDLVNDYLDRDIPVGAVIIDSPWENPKDTGYNTLEFDPILYPDPQTLITDLKDIGVHVIMWITGVIVPESPNYNFACENGYFVRKVGSTDPCPTTGFWKGNKRASQIDFFNPDAVSWWKSLMDPILEMGVDGWKVDQSDYYIGDLGDTIDTYAGEKSAAEYTEKYYRTMYEYTVEKRGAENGMIMARPYSSQSSTPPPDWYAPVDVNTAAWVGDQTHDWKGLQDALRDIFISAAAGYAALGSDIGGYHGGTWSQDVRKIDKKVLLRWAQVGALMPVMENGGLDEHRPWEYDEETTGIYRYYAKLHRQLVPYLYSYNIDASETGLSILRPVGTGNENDTSEWENDWRYLLGEQFLVAPIFQDQDSRDITFPEGRWIDYWDNDQSYAGGETINYSAPLARIPLFIRAGAVIPVAVQDSVTGHGSDFSSEFLTVLIYPEGSSSFKLRHSPESATEFTCDKDNEIFTLNLTPGPIQKYIFRIYQPFPALSVKLQEELLTQHSTFDDFENSSSGWYYTLADKYLWIKLEASSLVSLEVQSSLVIPVELSDFSGYHQDQYVKLSWTTASESNNYGFEIERSTGSEWCKIASVRGRGTTLKAGNYQYTDDLLNVALPDSILQYRLKQIDHDGTFSYSPALRIGVSNPGTMQLMQNYPNPFNPRTTIRYAVPVAHNVEIALFNIRGEKIRTLVKEHKTPGFYSMTWDGNDDSGRRAASGHYICRMRSNNRQKMIRMILVR